MVNKAEEKKERHYGANLVWLDLEFTSLDFDTNTIVEIATIITDNDLNILAEGPDIVIHHSDKILDTMSDWCKDHFKESGFLDEIRNSKISMGDAEAQTLEFVKKYTEERRSPLCGNSIGQDRRLLYKHMPALEKYFHYRKIDVSTIKELMYRWKPELAKKFKKVEDHRALADTRESIEELRFYRENFFVK